MWANLQLISLVTSYRKFSFMLHFEHLDFAFRSYIGQHKIAVVCSARSGSAKALGTTNLLLKAASEAQRQRHKLFNDCGTTTPSLNGIFRRSSETSPTTPMRRSSRSPSSPSTGALTPLMTPQTGQSQPEFNVTVDLIRSEHMDAAKTSIQNPEILQELEAEIDRDCDWLRSFLFAAQVHSIHLTALPLII